MNVCQFQQCIQRKRRRRNPSQFRAIAIRRNRKKPGGKRRIPPPAAKSAEGAQEGFLGHVLGTAAITAKTVREIDQRSLPARHNALEGGEIAGKYLVDILAVFMYAQAFSFSRMTSAGERRLHFLLFHVFCPKNATGRVRCRSYESEENIMSESIFLLLIVIAICSYFSVKVWVNAQRAEREAYYRTEAIKKIAELQGNVPEPVLKILREAMVQQPKLPIFLTYNPREREAFYRNETAKTLAESPAGAPAALDYLRQEEKKRVRRVTDGLRLGGLILLAIGIGAVVFMRSAETTREFYLAGLVPALIGIAMLVYTRSMVPIE